LPSLSFQKRRYFCFHITELFKKRKLSDKLILFPISRIKNSHTKPSSQGGKQPTKGREQMKAFNHQWKKALLLIVALLCCMGSTSIKTVSAAKPQKTPTPTPTTSPTVSPTASPSEDFMKGFDASYVTRVEDKGGVYKTSNGKIQDVFTILANSGINYIRLRVWVNPSEGYCNKADVLSLALRAKNAGLKLLIDFHYSDYWADPGQQTKPAAWNSYSAAQLNQAVYDYTYDVIAALNAQGTPADMVQVGNEITHGMLWPEGKVLQGDATYDTSAQWDNLAAMLNSGINAVNSAAPDALIMVHIASGDLSEMHWFYDNLIAKGVSFDIVGLSYYHNWHGTISDLSVNLNDIAARYGKPIVVTETSYPFTLGWNDWTNNIIGLEEQLLSGYPATVSGQTAFVQAVVDTVQSVPDGQGIGVFYWGGEWIATSSEDTDGSTWENQALFSFQSKALSTFSVFTNIP
jgi:arabinogalactan endo-1,4-beta-galactosidase